MPVPAERAVVENLAQAFLVSVARQPEHLAVAAVDGSLSLTWEQLLIRVRHLAAGLSGLGVRPSDTVALMLKNRPEFMLADVAIMCLGAVPFSIYPTLPATQILPILNNADCRVVLCESDFVPLIEGAKSAGAHLDHVVVLEGGVDNCRDWMQLESDGAASDFDLESQIDNIAPDMLAALVYTSGTTGPAKGVELTHAGLLKVVQNNYQYLKFQPDYRYLSWLPTAGMAERISSHYMPLVGGGTVYYCNNPGEAASALPVARPHIFFAPPRFWEKLQAAVEAKWAKATQAEQGIIGRALQEQFERVRLQQAGLPVPDSLAQACIHSDAKWFAPIRELLGLDAPNVYVCSGGAGASRSLLEFYYAIGLPLDEVYGQTESCALGTRSPGRGQMRMGTVGKAQPGVEIRLAEDGEILIRSAGVMRGYREMPDATDSVLDSEGWLHTGDIGSMDADGYLRIIDRKKEMIINSFGKNMSPVNIEAALTMAGPFISQAVVVGDGRNYNVALLTVDPIHLQSWAEREGLSTGPIDTLFNHPALLAEVESQVQRANAQLARVEQIKKFRVVGSEWSHGSEELTPTMKFKRRVINTKYAAVIEAMYQSGE